MIYLMSFAVVITIVIGYLIYRDTDVEDNEINE